jgi:hypothetical protein
VDPIQLFRLQQMMRQRQGGMFGGQQQPAMPQPDAPDGQIPAPDQHHHGGLHGILPYLGFGLLGGSLLGGNLGSMAPLFGLAGMLGKKAFK